MRRKLNVKFLLCLVAGLTVASGGVALAHHLQYRRIPFALLRQAQKAEDEHDLKRADEYISLYLDFEPGDVEQKARLARILTSKKPSATTPIDDNRAYFLLQYVLARDPERQDLRRLFVPLSIKMFQLEDAAAQLKLLPQSAETASFWASWYEANGHTDQAVDSYRESVKLDPANAEIVARFARLLRSRTWSQLTGEQSSKKREADAREADEVMDALIKAAPDSWQARLARWNYRRASFLFERRGEKRPQFLDMVRTFLIQDIVKDVEKALELREGEADVRLAAAEAAQMEGRLEAAHSHLEKALQLHRKEPQVYRTYAALELKVEEKETTPEGKTAARQRALSWLRQGTQELKPPAQTDLLFQYVLLLLETNTSSDLDEAATMINRVRVQNVSPAGADYLQGRLLMGRQQWAEAASLLERARPMLTDYNSANQIDLNLTLCYEELNNTDQQLASAKRMYDRNPGLLQARFNLATAEKAAGKLEASLRHFNETLSGSDAPRGIWIEQVRLAIVHAAKTNANADWLRVEQTFDDAKARNLADDVEIAHFRAESLLARDRAREAREVLLEIRKKAPERPEPWAALSALAERLKDPDEALRILEEAEKTLPNAADSIDLCLARASYWSARQNSQTKPELLKLSQLLQKREKFEPGDRYRLLQGLAEANYRAGNTEEAGRLWKVLAAEEHYKNDLRLRLVLFDLALQEGNESDMAALLKEVRRLEGGDGAFARHAEALRLIWLVKKNKVAQTKRGETLADAVRLLDQVAAVRPTWSATLLARAEIETIRGNPDQVLAAYLKAFQLGDRSPTVLRQVLETYSKQGKVKEATDFLARLTRDDRQRGQLERAELSFKLRSDNPDDAIQKAEEAIRADSRDYRDHLWLGRFLAASGKRPDQAEQSLRKAVDLETREAETWVALVRFLAGLKDKKKTDEARALLGVIQSSVKPADAALVAMAQCHSALGEGDKAREFYEQAVKARPNDAALLSDFIGFRLHRNELKEAEELVRRMLEDDVKKTAEETNWAHGRLAVLLSSSDDVTRFKEALTHVGLKMEESGEIVADESLVRAESVTVRRLAARVLAACPLWRCREAALKRFEELDQHQVLNADERYIMARLYEAKGDWPKMQQQLSGLSTSREIRPEHFITQAQGYLNSFQWKAAEPIVGRLENAYKAHPWPGGDVALVELRARLFEGRREGDKAVALLREWMGRSGGDPRDVLLLISSLGRQKRFAEALALSEEIWKACPPEMAGGTCVALLRSARATEPQRKQVETSLRAAVKKDAKNVSLMVQLGDVLDLGGSYEEAEGLYREALKLDPKNILVLNNLSWLLALRTERGTEALELINRAIDTVGPRGELLDTRSVVHLTLGKSAQAAADLEDALKDTPTGTRYFHLAQAQLAGNHRDAARRTLQQAKEQGLEPAQLHPVEQVAYRKILEQIGQQ